MRRCLLSGFQSGGGRKRFLGLRVDIRANCRFDSCPCRWAGAKPALCHSFVPSLRGPCTRCEQPSAYCRRATVWIVSTSTLANTWSKELEVATDAARKAAEIALRCQPNIVAETKPDNSPVTQADRECERMIARILSDAFPEDGILGEEGTGGEQRQGGHCQGSLRLHEEMIRRGSREGSGEFGVRGAGSDKWIGTQRRPREPFCPFSTQSLM